MNRSFLFTLGVGLAIILISSAVIFFAKGYTFNTSQGKIQKTGIMVVTSEPTNAAVYINGQLKDTTNTTINFLTPGWYKVRVTKDGFTPWEKTVEVREELVTRLDLTLFPQVPDLRRLTLTGAVDAKLTPDGQRIVYRVIQPDKAGLWVIGATDQLPFLNSDPIQIYHDLSKFDLAKAGYVFSPDSKNLLLINNDVKGQPVYYLLDLQKVNDNIVPMSVTDVQNLLVSWQDTVYSKQKNLRQKLLTSVGDVPAYESPKPNITIALAAVDQVLSDGALGTQVASPVAIPVSPKPSTSQASPSPTSTPSPQVIIQKIMALSNTIQWSPKQDKLLFTTTDGKTHIYDLTTGKYYDLQKADSYSWFPSDLHIIELNPQGNKGQIVITDIDGQNPILVYSGQFVDSIAFPAFSGTKIIILTNLNQAADTQPNLYAINLR